MRDTSKPANANRAGQIQLYSAGGESGNFFFASESNRPILLAPGRRIRQRWEATGAPTRAPESRGGDEPPCAACRIHSGPKALNPGSARAEPSQGRSVI